MGTNGVTSQRAELLYQQSDLLKQKSNKDQKTAAEDGTEQTVKSSEQAARAGAAYQAERIGAQADRITKGLEAAQEKDDAKQAEEAKKVEEAKKAEEAKKTEEAKKLEEARKFDRYDPSNPALDPSKDPRNANNDAYKVDGRAAFKVDKQQVMQMKEELKARMVEMVQKSLSRQITGGKSSKLFDLIRKGEYTQDDVEQAKKDVDEDGYWGVEQTSDRIVKMAQALTGGDKSKLDDMMEAFEKGYKAAEKAMGGTLPSISGRTRQAVLDKFAALKEQEDNQKVQEQNQPRNDVEQEQRKTGAIAAAAGLD